MSATCVCVWVFVFEGLGIVWGKSPILGVPDFGVLF